MLREKIITIGLIVIIVLFIPIFVTSLLTGIGKQKMLEGDILVKVRTSSDEEITLGLEEYLIGVVAAEMPAYFEPEALKAQAVAARTYTLKRLKRDENIVFYEDIQSYSTQDELERSWGVNDYAFYYSKIMNAVKVTKDIVITYNDELIDAIFHSTSIGITRSAIEVWGEEIPYLQGVESLEDINAPTYLSDFTFGFDEFIDRMIKEDNEIMITKDLKSEIQIIERSESGYINKIQVGNKIFTGEEFRKVFSLASSNFSIDFEAEKVEIVCKGYGHGVGMSQYGAESMAKAGATYQEILKHYYQNIEIGVK